MANVEFVNVIIDGKPLKVAKGTNIIEAAKLAGIEIPYYCYHPHLSIAGNCRMCQIEIKGRPKLEIGCNTTVAEGMEILTQHTSKAVKDAQAATLEFILINHPLDCTVCDQAGHCKLQDYHFEYNARPSRFVEDKVHKVKADPLGPTVILDGERCIMCTRCVRFCDEITETSELGMLNRGDRAVIATNQGRELNNPLSGTVVDLCPVGALTHRNWRFNTRVWFTGSVDSICPGCSTGCNVKVHTRDNEVVQVKARLNGEVNKEWLCDEGRYGYERFIPKVRVTAPLVSGKSVALDDALKASKDISKLKTLVFVSPLLSLEDMFILKAFLARDIKDHKVVLAYKERALSDVETVLVSPDYAANFRGAEFVGLVSGELEKQYTEALAALKSNQYKGVIFAGDWSLASGDKGDDIRRAIAACELSISFITDATSAQAASKIVIPTRTVLEKSGLMINRKQRLQYSDRVLEYPECTDPEWRAINRLSKVCGKELVSATADRDMTLSFLKTEPKLQGVTIATVKNGGVDLSGGKTLEERSKLSSEVRA